MQNSIIVRAVIDNPQLISQAVQLPKGERAQLRPLTSADAAVLGTYFVGLSAETRRRYGPHPFDQATADKLCAENDYAKVIRMLATVPTEQQGERVIAYFILVMSVDDDEIKRYAALGIGLDSVTDCTLAPSVADDYQDKGVGSIMLRHVIDSARHHVEP